MAAWAVGRSPSAPEPELIAFSSTHTSGPGARLLTDLDPQPTLGIRARNCSRQYGKANPRLRAGDLILLQPCWKGY